MPIIYNLTDQLILNNTPHEKQIITTIACAFTFSALL